MGQIISVPIAIVGSTLTYWRGLIHYSLGRGRHETYDIHSFAPLRHVFDDSPSAQLFKQHARVHLFGLASNFYLYNRPHYRKDSYRQDLLDNLRNVAIPGTGLPLSVIASSRWLAVPFLLFCNPTLCFAAACHDYVQGIWKTSSPVARSDCSESSPQNDISRWSLRRLHKEYATRLLAPTDWFAYWRLNCTVVALHALLYRNDPSIAKEYGMENKWTFLQEGELRGVPVSPFVTHLPAIVVKHRNEEGGLGIYFYQNAAAGGDWIIQERIENSKWVSSLLPPKAPLSTFRVITCSRAHASKKTAGDEPQLDDIAALSCVFRAGRAGAATDHDAILFNVDVRSGLIQGGTTNAHWYRLGLSQIVFGPWRNDEDNLMTHHPDGNIPVAGTYVPDINLTLQVVREAHHKLCPRVPLAGWDVVLTNDAARPICLLEVNLSCNFFRGTFDRREYLSFVEDSFAQLQALQLTQIA